MLCVPFFTYKICATRGAWWSLERNAHQYFVQWEEHVDISAIRLLTGSLRYRVHLGDGGYMSEEDCFVVVVRPSWRCMPYIIGKPREGK